MHGHLAAHLDPLGSEPVGDPALEPERLIPKLTPELQARIPASLLRLYVPARDARRRAAAPARDLLRHDRLRDRAHLRPRAPRLAAQGDRVGEVPPAALAPTSRSACSSALTEVEGFERYLRRAFLGQKQFSIEGLDVMVPMLDEAIELSAEAGAHEVVIGMAHRGRLSVLAHTLGQPYEAILREFEGERTIEAVVVDPEGGSGDVKYHLGAEGVRKTPSGEITVTLCANPSHLEAVDPVVEGRTRAEQTDRSTRAGVHDPGVALPILIHGDAVVRRPGGRRRDAQPRGPRRLHDRRHAPPDRQQPGRLHDRPRRGPLDPLLERPGEGLRHPDHPRQRRRPRGGDLGDPARARVPAAASGTTSSSTSSATAASATTSRTSPPTPSR